MQSQAQHERELFITSRSHQPRNDAVVFIENHVTLDAQQPLPVFSDRVDGFVPVEEAKRQDQQSIALWQQANEEINTLFDLMGQVQAKFGATTLQASCNLPSSSPAEVELRNCTWAQVMAEVQSAAHKWKTRPNKASKTMWFVDKVGQNSSALEAWIQLLPTGDYGASICGVFKLAISAAGHYERVQESVLESLSEIPRLMDNATRYVQIYRDMPDQFLEQHSFQLFRAILKTLRLVMKFFLESKRKKVFESIMKQDSYGAEMAESVEEVKKCVLRVKDEADLCKARQALAHGHLLSRIHETSTATNLSIQSHAQAVVGQTGLLSSINSRLEGQGDVLQAIYGLLNETLRLRNQLSAQHSLLSSSPSRSLRAGYDAANVDHGASEDEGVHVMTNRLSDLALSRQHNEEQAIVRAALSRLWEYLRYDPEMISRDVSQTLRDGHQLEQRTKSRASTLVNDASFQAFVTRPASMNLLVNGRQDVAAADGISPLSLVVAEMTKTIEENTPSVFMLKYFCNSRRPYRLSGETPKYAPLVEMMASLVGQLIHQMEVQGRMPNLSFLTNDLWHNLGKLRVLALCKTLRGLTLQLPPGSIVICAIDEISEYESKALGTKTDSVVAMLTEIAAEEPTKADIVFKLLMTCRDRALDVGEYFPDQILDMEEGIEEDSAADWTISRIGAETMGHWEKPERREGRW